MGRPAGRLAAAVIALTAWAGLGIQLDALLGRLGSLPTAVWEMSRYFTVSTNLVIALVFTGLAAGMPRVQAPRLIAGVALAILLVGAVYVLLLRGLLALGGGDAVADVLLHWVMPVLVPLYWAAFVPKGALRIGDPLLWALYPIAYLAYALVRGGIEGRYAYPFLDVGAIGWGGTLLQTALIATGFAAFGLGVVLLDRRLGRSRR